MFSTGCFRGLVEYSPGFAPRPGISHVLFDFDGTLSLVREGWVDVMMAMFLEMLPPLPQESEPAARQMLHDDIMRQNGKQTIYQMIQFAERIRERGGEAREPLWYKNEYLRRLDQRIADRLEGLRSGALTPDSFLVVGAREVLEHLQQRSVPLYLASGTDEPYVRREAQLLHIAGYFGQHIYGALDDYKKFSKKMIIERILQENNIPGEQLLAFGSENIRHFRREHVIGAGLLSLLDQAQSAS